MSQVYLKISGPVSPAEPGREVLIQFLGEIGFESFVETSDGLEAYIQKKDFNENLLRETLDSLSEIAFDWQKEVILPENWNDAWESNFEPVVVEDLCCIRAPFHNENPIVKLNVIITPKMSFGTGHHDTTWMMTKSLFSIPLMGKTVLDMGCGTGVLAIVARKLGASGVVGIDNDVWSFENARENCLENDCSEIEIILGDKAAIPDKKFDVILANINRNILLADMPAYVQHLSPNGILFLSGFYSTDNETLIKAATDLCLSESIALSRNGWSCLKFMLI